MDNIKKLLGKRIKELRKTQKLSQQQLAEKASIDQRSLSHIECGDTFPSKALLDISNALNVELMELFNFKHIELDTSEIKKEIIKNLDYLSDENIQTVYKFIKALR